jgi:hypothetical protein
MRLQLHERGGDPRLSSGQQLEDSFISIHLDLHFFFFFCHIISHQNSFRNLPYMSALSYAFFLARFNDVEYAWVGEANWTFTARFAVDPALLARQVVELDLHGVDTAAAVRLNGRLLGSTQNMFVRYIFPAKSDLVAGAGNILQVEFQSPVDYAAKAFESQSSERHTVPPACVAKDFQGCYDDTSPRSRTLEFQS